jgi:MinD superfamily P-loop ATPase
MRIAIASGKGGTGKTTVATNLARVAGRLGRAASYLDCDVEEPNGHIFLRPEITATRPIVKLLPEVDARLCNGCGRCGEICQFSAIVPVARPPMLFPELCHACGGCALVCPVGAVRERPMPVGRLRIGTSEQVGFYEGCLDVGEPISPPAIRAVKAAAFSERSEDELFVLDVAPGTACAAVEGLGDCDLAVLVTEPTPFGLHDLTLAVRLLRRMELPFGVVINRAGSGDDRVGEFCREEKIELLGEIPDSRELAEAYAVGTLAVEASTDFAEAFESLLETLIERARRS